MLWVHISIAAGTHNLSWITNGGMDIKYFLFFKV